MRPEQEYTQNILCLHKLTALIPGLSQCCMQDKECTKQLCWFFCFVFVCLFFMFGTVPYLNIQTEMRLDLAQSLDTNKSENLYCKFLSKQAVAQSTTTVKTHFRTIQNILKLKKTFKLSRVLFMSYFIEVLVYCLLSHQVHLCKNQNVHHFITSKTPKAFCTDHLFSGIL